MIGIIITTTMIHVEDHAAHCRMAREVTDGNNNHNNQNQNHNNNYSNNNNNNYRNHNHNHNRPFKLSGQYV